LGKDARPPAGWLGIAALVLVLAVAVGYTNLSIDLVMSLHRTVAGYTARAWQESEALRAIAQQPGEAILISNEPEAVLLYTYRYPHDLNTWVATDTDEGIKPFFGCRSRQLEQLFRVDGSYLVRLAPLGWTRIAEERGRLISPEHLDLCQATTTTSYPVDSIFMSTAPIDE